MPPVDISPDSEQEVEAMVEQEQHVTTSPPDQDAALDVPEQTLPTDTQAEVAARVLAETVATSDMAAAVAAETDGVPATNGATIAVPEDGEVDIEEPVVPEETPELQLAAGPLPQDEASAVLEDDEIAPSQLI